MNKELITSNRLDESYYKINHDSGLTIYVYPKKDYASTYAIFGTRYGSINNEFITDKGESVKVPDGIAHYLEHKLFESEDGDAFVKFAQTGANANAFTSFDRTCYLFSCSENFKESFEILLDFVQSPYFTEQTVQKEQGIIGQEIKMYDDTPSWRVLFNLLRALYHNNPVKTDIAGTVESIAKITPELLYTCYNNFYNLNNMVLAIVGNADVDEVLEIADRLLKKSSPMTVSFKIPDEPKEVVNNYFEEEMSISIPLIEMGYKEDVNNKTLSEKDSAATDILLAMIFSQSSELYKNLMEKKYINESFYAEYLEGPGYSTVIISAETKYVKELENEIKANIDNIHKNGLDDKLFELSKKSLYGNLVASADFNEFLANALVSNHFTNRKLFNYTEELAKITIEDVTKRFNDLFNNEYCSVSVIKPMKGSD